MIMSSQIILKIDDILHIMFIYFFNIEPVVCKENLFLNKNIVNPTTLFCTDNRNYQLVVKMKLEYR